VQLQQAEFELLRTMVYERTGLRFEDCKLAFVQARAARRMTAVGCETARDYYRYLRYHDPAGEEFQRFVECLTTNETYFFREFPQLRCFANEALPQIADARRAANDYSLRLWSAGCSTGDEAYTLAIILRACLDDFPRWKIHLLASDIDTQVLETARRGAYSARAVQDVPAEYLHRYFKLHLGEYHVNDDIKQMVTFVHLNLVDRPSMRKVSMMDFIFCRNVLIYFDDASRKQVLSSFYDALAPGGFIFLGHSESVGRISAAFEMVRLGDTITYRRPAGKEPTSDGFKSRLAEGGELCTTK